MSDSHVDPTDSRPLLCLDCGQRDAEPMGTYRVTAASIRECVACGEGPLVDVRDRSVVEALVTRRAQRQLARSRRLATQATYTAAALAVPAALAMSQSWRGLLASPLICFTTTCAMVLAGCVVAQVQRMPAAIESDMRRGSGLLRATVALVGAAILTVAIPHVADWALQGPPMAEAWHIDWFARQAEQALDRARRE